MTELQVTEQKCDNDVDIRVCEVEEDKCVCCVGLLGDIDEDGVPSQQTLDEWRGYAHKFAAAPDLLEVLKEHQWVEYSDPDWGKQVFCPECRNKPEHGHHKNCSIYQAINKAEKNNGL